MINRISAGEAALPPGDSRTARKTGARSPVSEQTRARMSAAAKARPRPPELGAAIAAGLREWYTQPEARLRGVRRAMTEEERENFDILRNKGGYSVRETLVKIGRRDLLNYRPTPQPPRRLYKMLSTAEKFALWGVWREAETWQDGLRLIGAMPQPKEGGCRP